MIDTHCHLTFEQLRSRAQDIMADAAAVGVRGAITVSTTTADCSATRQLAESFANVWCTAGVHPLYADKPIDWDGLRESARHPRCVAWGELGLDNHYDKPKRERQDRVLAEQLALIESCVEEGLELPVVVHCRHAFDELLAVFKTSSLDPARYVFHCFTGSADEAKRVIDFGAWISFTGVVTFRNAGEVAEAAKLVPADRIMVETDSPFLSPEPVRSMRPNEPKNVVHVVRRIAELRGVPYEDFERQLDTNAERFFGITLGEA